MPRKQRGHAGCRRPGHVEAAADAAAEQACQHAHALYSYGHTVMACISMAYIVMACIAIANIVMVCIAIANIVMAYIVMAYIVI